MKKETLLTIAVIGLLLLNLSTLGFLLLRRPPHPDGPGGPQSPGKHLVEKLHFTPEQQGQFEQLKSAHHELMMESDRAYHDALKNYFDLLKSDPVDTIQSGALLARMNAIQETRVTATFKHFADLKALCTQEQKAYFDAFLPELIRVILPKNGPPGRRE